MQMTFANRPFRSRAASSVLPWSGLELVETTGAIGAVHALAGRLMP